MMAFHHQFRPETAASTANRSAYHHGDDLMSSDAASTDTDGGGNDVWTSTSNANNVEYYTSLQPAYNEDYDGNGSYDDEADYEADYEDAVVCDNGTQQHHYRHTDTNGSNECCVLEVVAPCDMEEGYTFLTRTTSDATAIPVTAPPGGIKRGQTFVTYLRSSTAPPVTSVSGYNTSNGGNTSNSHAPSFGKKLVVPTDRTPFTSVGSLNSIGESINLPNGGGSGGLTPISSATVRDALPGYWKQGLLECSLCRRCRPPLQGHHQQHDDYYYYNNSNDDLSGRNYWRRPSNGSTNSNISGGSSCSSIDTTRSSDQCKVLGMSFFCPLVLGAQVMERVGLNWMGQHVSTKRNNNIGPIVVILGIFSVYWILVYISAPPITTISGSASVVATPSVLSTTCFNVSTVAFVAYTVFILTRLRFHVRKYFMIPPIVAEEEFGMAEDACITVCCMCCSVTQLSRQTHTDMDVDRVRLCTRTGLGPARSSNWCTTMSTNNDNNGCCCKSSNTVAVDTSSNVIVDDDVAVVPTATTPQHKNTQNRKDWHNMSYGTL